jgi:chromosome segregation ATPase
MGQRLLLVDSDRSFIKDHQVSLEAAFDLELAGSPDGVVSRLEGGGFAAVLICVEVSDNKGYALCSSIRKNPALDAVKTALISAKATDEEYRRHQGLKGRADLYLHKPMAPSALVAALTPLVPGRVLDPDNPLGELADYELGDDWLDGLKGSLEGTTGPAALAATAAAAVPPSSARTVHLDADEPVSSVNHLRQLEEQVANLEEVLRDRDQALVEAHQRLQEAELEVELLHPQTSSVTLNLDEAERSAREAESLQAQLKEALADRDRLHDAALDQESLRGQLQALEATLAGRDAEVTTLRQGLETIRAEEEQLNATLEALVGQHAALEAAHQAALQEMAGHQEKAEACQLQVEAHEANLSGQGQELSGLKERLRLAEEDLAGSQAEVIDRDQQLLSGLALVHELQEEGGRLGRQLSELQTATSAAAALHDAEVLELMSGLDQKDSEIARLKQALADREGALEALDQEKASTQTELSRLRDRIQQMDELLRDIQEKARQGSDLART